MSLPLAGRHVALLMGGLSPEREVSLVSGKACGDALDRLGAKTTRIDAGRDIAEVLARLRPDVCFNALHGEWGEDGCVQGVLETLQLPYSHSGVLASALAMDKQKSKSVMAAAGVAVPGGGLYDRREAARDHVMQPPYVVKPNAQGSSVGVFIVPEGANSPPRELAAPGWTLGDEVLIEPYVRGFELAVAVMGGQALAVTEIEPTVGFYDYEAKYGDRGSRHIIPARIPPKAAQMALRYAELAHASLGCQGVTRSDLRYDDINDILVLLEVNTQPGMTPTSLAPEQAAHKGIGFDELVLWITEDAYARCSAGGRRAAVKPRAKAPLKSGKPRTAKAAPQGPSKLRAAQRAGISPGFAVLGAAAVLTVGVAVALGTGNRGQKLVDGGIAATQARLAAAGFKLKTVHLQGASPLAQGEILAAAALHRDEPLLAVDLEAVRARVERVGWVRHARVIRLLPDTMVIAVDQRPLMAVWQHAGRVNVVDAEGAIVGEADPGHFPNLPLIVGEGANTAAAGVLPAVASRPRLAQRVEALVRVDDRRWDLRLKDGSLIQLPAENEEAALIRLDQLDLKSRILELGFARVDLRDPEMVAVRPRGATTPAGQVADGV